MKRLDRPCFFILTCKLLPKPTKASLPLSLCFLVFYIQCYNQGYCDSHLLIRFLSSSLIITNWQPLLISHCCYPGVLVFKKKVYIIICFLTLTEVSGEKFGNNFLKMSTECNIKLDCSQKMPSSLLRFLFLSYTTFIEFVVFSKKHFLHWN